MIASGKGFIVHYLPTRLSQLIFGRLKKLLAKWRTFG
jgi:hypothetical protein